eukprot:SAG31_NODE_11197_length_1055_cov_1.506276_1_plen_135_part_10
MAATLNPVPMSVTASALAQLAAGGNGTEGADEEPVAEDSAADGGLGQLIDGLVLHALSPYTVLATKASSALINLGIDTTFRRLIGRVGRVGLLLKAAQIDGVTGISAKHGNDSAGTEAVVVNTLGVLANCAMDST